MNRTEPQHGERRCYLRGCRRPECRTAHYRYMSRYRLDAVRGNSRRVASAPATAHVQNLIEQGWSRSQIADVSGCTESAVVRVAQGVHPTIRADLSRRILAAQPTIRTVNERSSVVAIGTIRRVRALIAIGHQLIAIAEASGITKTALGYIVNHENDTLTARHARAVAATYRAWSDRPGPSVRSRKRAVANGWPPPAAWDDERIDDPSATPDWTGACGTDRGWWMHTLQKLPMCDPCQTAHEEWKAEHRGLPCGEFQVALMASRASASSRGIDIATDARELMRLGCDYEQAAARLGVTRNHLQQELKRHPETAQAA